MKKFKNFSLGLVATTLLSTLFIGCGGGSGSSDNGSVSSNNSSESSSIGGTVAVGAGILATVEILDTPTCNTYTVQSNAQGTWTSGDTTGMNGPFLIKASSSVGFTMYSYVDVTSSRIANVTPLTYYTMDATARNIAGRSIADMYASCNNGNFTGLSDFNTFETSLNTQVQTLNTHLSNAGYTNSNQVGFNHFNDSFSANQTGYDALLDEIDMSMNNNTTIIRVDNQILETSDDDITAETTQAITGKVVDSSNTNLTGVTVTIKKDDLNETVVESLTTDVSGNYIKADLEKYRDYIITFEKDGYASTSLRYDSFSTNNPEDIVLLTNAESIEATEVSPTINIINSRNGDSISEVTIKVRNGSNNRLGTVTKTILDNDSLALTPGLYTLEFTKTGYDTKYVNTTILSSTSTLNIDMLSINSSSSINSSAFATVILRWGENPNDLDSHTQLTVDNTNISINYINRQHGAYPADRTNPCNTSGVVASLDLDDTSSYGPETTTICDGSKGPFDFKVHHYSGTQTIGSSPTSVELITRDGSRYEFTPPTSGFSGQNDVWNVFTLDENQSVSRINTVTQDINNSSYTVTTDSLSNKSFRFTPNDNSGYVDFVLNSNGTGTETGYLQDNSQEYTENITWNVTSGQLEVTTSDNDTTTYVFYNTPANGVFVTGHNSDEPEIRAIISNFDNVLLTKEMFDNVVYRLTPTDNSGFVYFTLNSNGTGEEKGYLSNNTLDYTENISWIVENNVLKVTLEDNSVDSYYFTDSLANDITVNVRTSDEHPFNATINHLSNF